jgi:hypothetical protein
MTQRTAAAFPSASLASGDRRAAAARSAAAHLFLAGGAAEARAASGAAASSSAAADMLPPALRLLRSLARTCVLLATAYTVHDFAGDAALYWLGKRHAHAPAKPRVCCGSRAHAVTLACRSSEAEALIRGDARLAQALGEPVTFGPWCAQQRSRHEE